MVFIHNHNQLLLMTSSLTAFQLENFSELQAYCFTHLEAMHAIKTLKKTRGNAYKIINMHRMAEEPAEPKEKKDFITWFINLDNDPKNEERIINLLYKKGYSARLAERRYREAVNALKEGW